LLNYFICSFNVFEGAPIEFDTCERSCIREGGLINGTLDDDQKVERRFSQTSKGELKEKKFCALTKLWVYNFKINIKSRASMVVSHYEINLLVRKNRII